jgi:CRISPR-associated protein Cas1
LDELRGREGNAAREYFGLYRRLLKPPRDGNAWGFDRREYYPPPDPINALLSFGYTLLLNDIIASCQMAGLDPDLGFFHAIDYGKPCMALDLEEEFRPLIVDSIVLYCANQPILRLSDFEAGQSRQAEEDEDGETTRARPVQLNEAARKRFIALYETRMNEQVYYTPSGEQTTYRRVLELQAYQMGRAILGEVESYTPLLVR